jgi:hypothetical protein
VAKERLATFFVSYYVKGLWFDLVHVVSVVASILALFLPLVKIGERVKVSLEKAQQVEDDNPSQ